MDKNVKLIVLIGAGGVGVYLLYQYLDQNGYLVKWFPTLFGPATPTTASGAIDCAALVASANKEMYGISTKDLATLNANGVTLTSTQAAQMKACGVTVLTSDQVQKAKQSAAPPAGMVPMVPKVCSQELRRCPDGSPMMRAPDCTWLPAECPTVVKGIDCQPGFYNYNGQCVPQGTGNTDIWTQIATAAGNARVGPLLTMDQWCYYAEPLGLACPDPGSIDPGVYGGAWATGADRSTPIDIGTFKAIVVLVTGAAGVSGIGMGMYAGWLT